MGVNSLSIYTHNFGSTSRKAKYKFSNFNFAWVSYDQCVSHDSEKP